MQLLTNELIATIENTKATHFRLYNINKNLYITSNLAVTSKLTSLVTTDIDVVLCSKQLSKLKTYLKTINKIAIEATNDGLLIKHENKRFLLDKQRLYIEKMRNTGDLKLTIDTKEFKDAINFVKFAIAKNDVRQYLNYILLELKDNQLFILATDAHRLARIEIKEFNIVNTGDFDFFISSDILKDIENFKGSVTNIKTNNTITNANTFIFNTDNGFNYPDYRSIIPRDIEDLPYLELYDTKLKDIQLLKSLADKKKYKCTIETTTSLKQVKMSLDNNRASIENNINPVSDHIKIGININYLYDHLNKCSDNRLYIKDTMISSITNNTVLLTLGML